MKSLITNENGQSIVEAAVSMGLLLCMVIGVMEGGWLLYAYHYTAYTAREGARWATVRGSACANTTVATAMPCPVLASDVQTYVVGMSSAALIKLQPSDVSVSWQIAPNGTAPCSPSTQCNNPGDQVVVKVSYNFLLSVPLIPIPSVKVHSTSQMIMSQ